MSKKKQQKEKRINTLAVNTSIETFKLENHGTGNFYLGIRRSNRYFIVFFPLEVAICEEKTRKVGDRGIFYSEHC